MYLIIGRNVPVLTAGFDQCESFQNLATILVAQQFASCAIH